MAKKTVSFSYKELKNSILQGSLAPVYLLMGDEDFYIDQIADLLEKNVVSEDERDFNSAIFYGADAEIKNIISRSQQFPLMSERQLVMLKEAQTMQSSKTQLEKLVPYINHANINTVLVIIYKGDFLNNTSQLIKSIQKINGVIFRSERPKDYQLTGPLSDYCNEKKVRIDDKSLSLLCDYIGSPLSKLFSEVDKLILSVGKGGSITPEIIESIIGISKEYNSFELIKSISLRDYPKTIRILEYFSRNPKQNPGVLIVATLFNFFSKLFIVAVAKDKTDGNLMQLLDLKTSYSLTDYKNGLKNFKAGTIDAILHAIRSQDVMSKGVGSTQNEYELLKELIFKIFTLR